MSHFERLGDGLKPLAFAAPGSLIVPTASNSRARALPDVTSDDKSSFGRFTERRRRRRRLWAGDRLPAGRRRPVEAPKHGGSHNAALLLESAIAPYAERESSGSLWIKPVE